MGLYAFTIAFLILKVTRSSRQRKTVAQLLYISATVFTLTVFLPLVFCTEIRQYKNHM